MERQRPDINPMPHFDLIPHPLESVAHHIQHTGAILVGFVLNKHEIPPHDFEPSTVDEMLLQDVGFNEAGDFVRKD